MTAKRQATTQDRPNILLYCTDQQRFDTIGALGNPYVQTPTLDKLVSNGVAFTHSYCQSPICTPSRSSFMTGMYPSRIHNNRNGNEEWPNHPPLISKLLADGGYSCGLVGKFHLQSSGYRTEPRLDDGFNYWKFSHAPRDDWQTGHDYADWVKAKGGDLTALRDSEEKVPSEFHQTTWITDCALDFIEMQTEPWFLILNPYDPHPPFIPPKSYADRFDPITLPGPHFEENDLRQQEDLKEVAFQTLAEHPDSFEGKKQQALYYAMIAQIDDQFGRLLEGMASLKQLDNTVIIFCSDHGEMLGDHGLLFKGCRFYEGLVRVPLIISWPARFKTDMQSDALVELLDMSATILDIAGIAAPEAMQGKSLLPILAGEQTLDHHRDFVRCEYFDALDTSFVQGSLSYGTMYRNRRYKLVLYHSHNLGEVYDLETDPWEHHNLWHESEHQALKHQLIQESFNATMMQSIDLGSRRIAPM
ncbi:MAG: sulfatase-like hydrolase/transferase [Trueperaceae bacterium]|nr:sulfatase-like hydrolase/transferase [Trueperaceae bacterium]